MIDLGGGITETDTSKRGPPLVINSLSSFTPTCDVTDNDNFASFLENKVQATVTVGKVVTKSRRGVDAPTLARRWNIPLGRAKNTLRRTTQFGVRTIINPTLSRRFPTNDRWF